MGRYKSYLTGVQNKGGGGVEATFGQCPKERCYFMASLRSETKKDKPVKRVLRETVFSEMNFFALLSLTIYIWYFISVYKIMYTQQNPYGWCSGGAGGLGDG
jgi:hypothetical protein